MRLSWDVRGQGPRPPLMLLHGFTGSREAWHRVEPLLGEDRPLIRVDLPGHGQSPLPSCEGRDGFFETLDALEQVLDELGLPEVDLAGYSQGARVALGCAFRWQRRVRRLVLESGTAGLHRRKARAARRRSDALLAQRIERRGVAEFISQWETLPLFDGLRGLPEDVRRALHARRSASTATGLAGALRALGLGAQPDYWPHLWKLQVPTLLLTGARDLKFTALARCMAAELPMVWSHAFADAGHAPHLEVPEAWAKDVTQFLNTPWFEVPTALEEESRSSA